MATASKNGSSTLMELPQLNLMKGNFLLIGTTPLITHAFSQKAKTMMRNKQTGVATAGRERRNVVEDFKSGLYPMPNCPPLASLEFDEATNSLPGGRWGMPVLAFKNAAVSACTSLSGVTKVAARQAFRMIDPQHGSELVEIFGPPPTMREDTARIGQNTTDLRYRPQFDKWSVLVRVEYNANVLSLSQVGNLLNSAGFAVGVGDWRPEKDGQYGTFRMATEEEMQSFDDVRMAA